MKNKSLIMAIAALQILVFHLWIPVFPGNELENFIRQTSSIGVELFFLVSGYAMADSRVDNYRQFIWNRFNSVYLKFILFALLAFFYSGWTFDRLLKTIFMVNLFEKGGGAFLWFVPGIMIYYLVFPWIKKCNAARYPLLLLLLWLVVGLLVSNTTNYKAMFIWWNRIPVFLIGYYWGSGAIAASKQNKQDKGELDNSIAEYNISSKKERKLSYVIKNCFLVFTGLILIYFFAYKSKLQVPVRDIFYIIYIPTTVGLAVTLNQLDMKGISQSSTLGNIIIMVIKRLGKSTLEMYAIQMIFGYSIANFIYKLIEIPMISNIVTIIIVCAVGIILNMIYSYCSRVIIKVIF